ncbi:MAG: glycosyltransferase [Planctomycetes bacterium B3_Pla]|nr:MAG: glycosyltransferase [Planctomycetes bacterium B3_Pla]
MNSASVSKKRLLFVIPSLVAGGAERVLIRLINHLDENKYDILLAVFEDKMDCASDLKSTVKIVCLNKKRGRRDFFNLILRLRKAIVSFKPAAVVSFIAFTNIVTVIATLFPKKISRVIISERSYHRTYLPLSRLKHLRRTLMKVTYRKADKIVTVSKSIKEALEQDFGIQSQKIVCIYNPVPVEEIRDKSKDSVGHPLLTEKNKVIVAAGRLEHEKRFDRLLRMFSSIREEHEDARLIILGSGTLLKPLQDLASQLNIGKWVDFVGYKSNPYAWISKADVFVLSSDREGLPNAILEAMACGVPVVATDCLSGPSEIITHSINGLLVPPADEQALAESVSRLLQDNALHQKLSQEGMKRAEDFVSENILPQYEQLF